jgi:hypothetical protein
MFLQSYGLHILNIIEITFGRNKRKEPGIKQQKRAEKLNKVMN